MTSGETLFLGLVVASLTIFAVALAYASWVASGNNPQSKRRVAAANDAEKTLAPADMGVPLPH